MDERQEIKLPIIDLSSSHLLSSTSSLRQACIEFGFFYVVNHGVGKDLLTRLFDESGKFFSLPLEEKMKLSKKEHRGYTALYAEKLDTTIAIGDAKESFYIGPVDDETNNLNQWPSNESFPDWRSTMETYHTLISEAGKKVLSLVALALNLEQNFFENIGALDSPQAFLRLLHYPAGHSDSVNGECLGASAHSDYGMITLLVTNGVSGLQVCREKDCQPPVWEDVPHIEGALVVNIGDMMERWTNCLFRSTLHRVIPTGKERYSVAFFLHSPDDLLVECLPSCCSESNPPRFPPIRAGDHLCERLRLTYGDN